MLYPSILRQSRTSYCFAEGSIMPTYLNASVSTASSCTSLDFPSSIYISQTPSCPWRQASAFMCIFLQKSCLFVIWNCWQQLCTPYTWWHMPKPVCHRGCHGNWFSNMPCRMAWSLARSRKWQSVSWILKEGYMRDWSYLWGYAYYTSHAAFS